MATRTGRLLTYEDYCAFPDDGTRREIIGGKLYVTPGVNTRHQILGGRIFTALFNHIEAHGGGIVLFPPYDIKFSDFDVVQPDILFVDESRMSIITEANAQGAPTLCVEVLSDPRHDRIRKRRLYEAMGVSNYWIFDPKKNHVETFRLEDGRYAAPEIKESGVLSLPELPGFALDLSWLFRP